MLNGSVWRIIACWLVLSATAGCSRSLPAPTVQPLLSPAPAPTQTPAPADEAARRLLAADYPAPQPAAGSQTTAPARPTATLTATGVVAPQSGAPSGASATAAAQATAAALGPNAPLPEDVSKHLGAATYYSKTGRYEDALAEMDAALKDWPGIPILHEWRSEFAIALGRYDEAFADGEAVVSLRPGEGSSYEYRGTAYLYKGDLDHAIADVGKAIELGVKSGNAYAYRGMAYVRKGDYARAQADLDFAISQNPYASPAFHGRGMLNTARGDYDRAVADFSAAIKSDPSYADPYLGRAEAYRAQGKLREALADLQKYVQLGADPELRKQAQAQLTELSAVVTLTPAPTPTRPATPRPTNTLAPPGIHFATEINLRAADFSGESVLFGELGRDKLAVRNDTNVKDANSRMFIAHSLVYQSTVLILNTPSAPGRAEAERLLRVAYVGGTLDNPKLAFEAPRQVPIGQAGAILRYSVGDSDGFVVVAMQGDVVVQVYSLGRTGDAKEDEIVALLRAMVARIR